MRTVWSGFGTSSGFELQGLCEGLMTPASRRLLTSLAMAFLSPGEYRLGFAFKGGELPVSMWCLLRL